jgi:hypothetical protein
MITKQCETTHQEINLNTDKAKNARMKPAVKVGATIM